MTTLGQSMVNLVITTRFLIKLTTTKPLKVLNRTLVVKYINVKKKLKHDELRNRTFSSYVLTTYNYLLFR